MASEGHRSPKTQPLEPSRTQLADSVRMLADGRSDAYVEGLVFGAGTTRTTVDAVDYEQVAEDSVIVLSPRSAAAAALAGAWWIESKGNGSFVVRHGTPTGTAMWDVAWQG